MITRLGHGGMGEVWHADDLILQTPVALKLIYSTSERGRERILNEARLAHLGAARAAVLTGDVARARRSYEQLFSVWSGADSTLQPLTEARREYARLQ